MVCTLAIGSVSIKIIFVFGVRVGLLCCSIFGIFGTSSTSLNSRLLNYVLKINHKTQHAILF